MNSFRRILSSAFLLILVFLSLFPRAVEIINHNYIFLLDQGRDYLTIRNMVINHKVTLIGSEIGGGYAGFSGIFQGPFHYYFLAIPFLLSHGDPYSGIVWMFCVAMLTIVASLFLGSKLFGKVWGIVMAILVAISPPLISQARYVWNPHSSTLFIVLAFFFVYRSYNKNIRYIFLAGFFTAFTYNYEIAITVPLTITLYVYSIIFLRFRFKELLVLTGGVLLGVLPVVLFEVRHHFIAIHGIISYLSTPHSSKGYNLINNHLTSFVYNLQDTFPHIAVTQTIFFPILFTICSVYLFFIEKRMEIRSMINYFLILLLITIGVLSFLRNYLFMYYLIDLNIVYIVLFTYVLYSAVQQKNYFLMIPFGIVFFVFIGVSIKLSYFTTLHDLPDYGGISKIKGKEDAIDYIYRDSNGKKFGLYIFAPTIYTDPYDYLVVWYGQQKYHYIPSQTKKGIFYLLIEPDPSKPWTYNGWLETVIKTGKVIKTEKLKSGLIVQKRIGK